MFYDVSQRILVFLCILIYVRSGNGECEKINEKGLLEDDDERIIENHNRIRQSLMNGEVTGQPKGINLKFMKWDPDLAKIAQYAIQNCTVSQANTFEGKRFDKIGKNVYEFKSDDYLPGTVWSEAIEKWYRTRFRYKYGDQIDDQVKPYTQLVWADSEYVGCGFIAYRRASDYYKLHLCYYFPEGNVENQNPYKAVGNRSRRRGARRKNKLGKEKTKYNKKDFKERKHKRAKVKTKRKRRKHTDEHKRRKHRKKHKAKKRI